MSMRTIWALAGALAIALAGPAAKASVVYTENGFSFDLAPDSGDLIINSDPTFLGYCPECTASPNILTITRTDNQPFDLLSMKIAGFSLTGWTVTAEEPLGTVLGTVTVSTVGGGPVGVDPGAAPSQSVGTGFVSTLSLVEHGGQDDCVCIADLNFRVGSDAGPIVTVLANTPTTPVPEPGSFALLASGVLGVGLGFRRRAG